jgi:hypothetical protein
MHDQHKLDPNSKTVCHDQQLYQSKYKTDSATNTGTLFIIGVYFGAS